MKTEWSAEWRSRSFFAEMAETLKVDTKNVLAAHGFQKGDEEWFFVLYSPELDVDELWSVWLRRGQDGILFEGSPRTPHPGLWQNIEDALEEAMTDGD